MDLGTRKIMSMHKGFHPRDGVGRQVSRKEGWSGLASIEDSVDATIQRLEDYVEKLRGRLITTTESNTDHSKISRTTITRKQKWEKTTLWTFSATNKWYLIRQNYDKIRTLGENETDKYVGILEADTIKQMEMKDKIQKEYLWRTRKLLETKFSSRNFIKGINTGGVPLVRYSGPFLNWTRDELKQMDQRTRKLMIKHKALNPRDDVNWLYVSRKDRGRVLASIEDSVVASIQRLKD